VLIGCFGDPGLLALRESSNVPVTGLAEASFIEAERHGRFAIVTGGARWGPMLQRLAQTLGHAPMLAGIHTVAPTGAQLAADPTAARALLAQACRDVAHQLGVQSVILGGAGLAGMAAVIQSQVDVPVIDSVIAGANWALRSHARRRPNAASRGATCCGKTCRPFSMQICTAIPSSPTAR
jgi:allantoin racemase